MTFHEYIALYIFFQLVISVVYIVKAEQCCALGYYGFITKYVYENSEMNIVGCILVASLYYIIFPILFIIRGICMTIYWLLHIGRK